MIELAEASILVAASPERVFELFSTESGLCSWMAQEATIDLRPGGRWRWVHDNGVAASGEYLAVEPPHRLRFTYGWESGPYADMAPGSTTVDVTFEASDEGTSVTVSHRAVPVEFRAAHSAGWSYFLGVLVTAAAGSTIDGPRLPADGPATDHSAHDQEDS